MTVISVVGTGLPIGGSSRCRDFPNKCPPPPSALPQGGGHRRGGAAPFSTSSSTPTSRTGRSSCGTCWSPGTRSGPPPPTSCPPAPSSSAGPPPPPPLAPLPSGPPSPLGGPVARRTEEHGTEVHRARTHIRAPYPFPSSANGCSRPPPRPSRNDAVVSAATVRLHKMSQAPFLEVILFATHKGTCPPPAPPPPPGLCPRPPAPSPLIPISRHRGHTPLPPPPFPPLTPPPLPPHPRLPWCPFRPESGLGFRHKSDLPGRSRKFPPLGGRVSFSPAPVLSSLLIFISKCSPGRT